MNLNRFKKTTSFEGAFVDWISTGSLDWLRPPEIDFYRAQIKKSIWENNLPRIQLHRMRKYNLASEQWGRIDLKKHYFFDFVKLKKKEIQFATKRNRNGSIRFKIFFGIEGLIIPQKYLPKNHGLLPMPATPLKRVAIKS